jgi:hypothetical protein
VVILRSALFAGRRTYGFADGGSAAGQMHRSFVGNRPLARTIPRLRMTSVWVDFATNHMGSRLDRFLLKYLQLLGDDENCFLFGELELSEFFL